jgi:hypothetical protein
MPYYFGEDMPEWDAYFANAEDAEPVIPPDAFKYIEPWAKEATVISFPNVPGPELEEPVYTPTNFHEYFQKDQAFRSTRALNQLSVLAEQCRTLGVKYVLGSYQGGNDEGFTHFHAVILIDGSRVERPTPLHKICDPQTIKSVELADGQQSEAPGTYLWGLNELLVRAINLRDGRRIERPSDLPTGIDFDELVDNAVTALMGNWGAGSYELYGAVTIDINAQTITDEEDRASVFAAKVT